MSMMNAATVSCEKTDGAEAGEFMLFGVRVIVDPIRKSVSLNNLFQYDHRHDFLNNINSEKDVAAGYASADEAVHRQSSSTAAAGNSITATTNINSRERKRGVPWTEEEHKLFLIGLQKVGKGDWRCISRNFVKTRTPTQVASHAQKYFLRRSNLNRRRRRSSLFDITTDTVSTTAAKDRQMSPAPSLRPIKSSRIELPATALVAEDSRAGLPQAFFYPATFSSTTVLSASPSNPNVRGTLSEESYRQNDDQNNNLMRPLTGKSISEFDMNENWLSLSLSLSSENIKPGFAVDTSFSNGDGIVSVA